MRDYNEQLTETNQTCLSDNGVFCESWFIQTSTYYPLELPILLLIASFFVLVVKWIRNL